MNARNVLRYLSLRLAGVMLVASFGFILIACQRGEPIGPPAQGNTAEGEAVVTPDFVTSQSLALATVLKPFLETLTPTATAIQVLQPSHTAPAEEHQALTETQPRPSRMPKMEATLLPTAIAVTENTPKGLTSAPTASEPALPTTSAPFASSTPLPTFTPLPTSSPTASASPSPSATASPIPRANPSATPQELLLPIATATPLAAGISGRVLLNGRPVEPGLVLALEDADFNQIAETTVGIGGAYQFTDLPASDVGYNVTFSWARNQTYDPSAVIAWGWIGPVPYDGQSALQLPDLEIALLGLEPVQPEPDTTYSAASISAAAPLSFSWSPYPRAERFWVDIQAGPALESVWRSQFVQEPFTEFDGLLDDGSRIQPGVFWWAVGSQITLDGYRFTVSGQRNGLRIRP